MREKDLFRGGQSAETFPEPEPWSAGGVAQRAFKGALALGVRQVLVHGANVLGSVLLARLLTPAEFGLFGIVVFLMFFLIVFGGTGLAANLIRQEEEPTEADYRAVFGLQQVVVVCLVVVFWLASPLLAAAYGLPPADAWLFRLLALSLLITSFMVIPQVRLERNLQFDKLAVVEVSQALVFNTTAVLLAWWGLGGMAFALAVVMRALIGAVTAHLVEPWPVRWRWDWRRARGHVRFGLDFQGSQFVSVAKDSITPILVGLLLGLTDVGYVTWAGMVAAYPVLALMVLQRVYMPAFARMQAYPEELGRFTEKVIWATNALTAPLSVLTLVLIDPLTRLLFGEQWLVALPLFYLLWAANLFVPTVTPLLGLLNALGRSRVVLGFALLWMLGTWALGAPLVLFLGVAGVALANLGVQLTNLWLYRIAKREVHFRILPVIWPVWALGAGVGLLVYLVQRIWPAHDLPILALYGAAGLAVYGLGMLLFYPGEVRRVGTMIRGTTP